jgi:hypothetical protein
MIWALRLARSRCQVHCLVAGAGALASAVQALNFKAFKACQGLNFKACHFKV